MSGFDNDWRCPNHTMERSGKPEPAHCPAGGCSKQQGCTRDKRAALERLTSQRIPLASVHQE